MKRVAVAYNVDFQESSPADDAGHAARRDVADAAAAVASALSGAFDVTLVPVDADLHAFCERVRELAPDAVFNLCESVAGDARLESTLPMLLEAMKVPYTGSPPAALALALRKDRVKTALERAGIPTPRGGLFAALPDKIALPCIVKPSREDGSAGIVPASVAHDTASVRRRAHAIERAFHQPAIVEEYVDGRELNVAVLGGSVLPLWEIDFSRMPKRLPKIVTYESKWRPGSVEDLGARPRRARLSGGALRAVRRVALEAFEAVGLRDYGRIDVRLDRAGVPWVVDVNPNCDLSPTAGFARAAQAGGVGYPALVKRLVGFALGRKRRSAR